MGTKGEVGQNIKSSKGEEQATHSVTAQNEGKYDHSEGPEKSVETNDLNIPAPGQAVKPKEEVEDPNIGSQDTQVDIKKAPKEEDTFGSNDNSSDQISTNKMSSDKNSSNTNSSEENVSHKSGLNKNSYDKNSSDKKSSEKNSFDKAFFEQPVNSKNLDFKPKIHKRENNSGSEMHILENEAVPDKSKKTYGDRDYPAEVFTDIQVESSEAVRRQDLKAKEAKAGRQLGTEKERKERKGKERSEAESAGGHHELGLKESVAEINLDSNVTSSQNALKSKEFDFQPNNKPDNETGSEMHFLVNKGVPDYRKKTSQDRKYPAEVFVEHQVESSEAERNQNLKSKEAKEGRQMGAKKVVGGGHLEAQRAGGNHHLGLKESLAGSHLDSNVTSSQNALKSKHNPVNETGSEMHLLVNEGVPDKSEKTYQDKDYPTEEFIEYQVSMESREAVTKQNYKSKGAKEGQQIREEKRVGGGYLEAQKAGGNHNLGLKEAVPENTLYSNVTPSQYAFEAKESDFQPHHHKHDNDSGSEIHLLINEAVPDQSKLNLSIHDMEDTQEEGIKVEDSDHSPNFETNEEPGKELKQNSFDEHLFEYEADSVKKSNIKEAQASRKFPKKWNALRSAQGKTKTFNSIQQGNETSDTKQYLSSPKYTIFVNKRIVQTQK